MNYTKPKMKNILISKQTTDTEFAAMLKLRPSKHAWKLSAIKWGFPTVTTTAQMIYAAAVEAANQCPLPQE